MSYLIAFCESNRELVFRDAVQRYGVEVYAPVSRIQVKRRCIRKKLIIERAIFPHYVFVELADQIYDLVRVMPGFLSWLWLAEDEIATLGNVMVEELKERAASGEFDRISKDPALIYTVGTQVKVLSGAMANMTGIVKRPPTRQGLVDVEICGKICRCPLVILAAKI